MFRVSLRIYRARSRFLACILASFSILAESRRRRRVHRRCFGDHWVVAFMLVCSASSTGSNAPS
jgi:hypothetical protein